MLGPVPATGRFGLTETDPDEVGRLILAGWDEFLDVVGDPSTDLSRPSRLAGWSGKDLLIHLGAWDDAPGLASVLASARDGVFEPAPAPDAANKALVAAHRDASLGEVLQSLELSRQRIEDFFAGPELATYATTLSRSSVGRCRCCPCCTPARTNSPSTQSISLPAARRSRPRSCWTAGSQPCST